jgi:transposase
MVKNSKLAKSISDASWSSFTQMLEYKCNWYGKCLIKIDRFYPSSKTCSECGYKLDTLELDVREWECPNCNTVHNRDLNAAKNILRKGFSDLTGIPEEFDNFPKLSSVESIEYSRGEAVRPMLFSDKHHLAASVKRLVV